MSRLDRVSAPQVELALSLYRDVDLLKFILAGVKLPEAAERVAISLDHPSEGPFLIVTRDGKFVTCLGAGMSVDDLPVITRGQLDGIGAKASVLRERMELCKALAGGRGGVGKLLRRICDAGDELSREEFLGISALQPIYARTFLKLLFETAKDIADTRDILLRELRRTDKLKPQFRESLHGYWKNMWAIGHLCVLSLMDGRAMFEELPDRVIAAFERATPSWCAVQQGVLGLAVKGAWTSGRVGKALLPAFKKRFASARSHLSLIDAIMGLTLIGIRHSRLRTEVKKTLTSEGPVPEDGVDAAYANLARVAGKIAAQSLDDPEKQLATQRDIGAKIALFCSRDMPKGSPYRFETREDVPEDLAMSLAVNDRSPFLMNDKGMSFALLVTFAPWISKAAPEQLYLPAGFLKAIHEPWEPEFSLRILRAHRADCGPETAHVTEGPARKGPCPCGSGKKYKRCCGEGGAAAKNASANENDGDDDRDD